MRPFRASAARLAKPCARLAPSVVSARLITSGLVAAKLVGASASTYCRVTNARRCFSASGSGASVRELVQVVALEQVVLLQQREIRQLAAIPARRSGGRRVMALRPSAALRPAVCAAIDAACAAGHSASHAVLIPRVERGKCLRHRRVQPLCRRRAAASQQARDCRPARNARRWIASTTASIPARTAANCAASSIQGRRMSTEREHRCASVTRSQAHPMMRAPLRVSAPATRARPR